MEDTERTSWLNRLMGEELSKRERRFFNLIKISILGWPVALGSLMELPKAPSVGQTEFASALGIITFYITIFYPIYIIPLTIFARRLAKEREHNYLYYLISAAPAMIIIPSCFFLKSSLAEKKPEGYDFLTYEKIGFDMNGVYSRDAQHIYYHLDSIQGADIATFHLIGNNTGYSADKNHVYYHGEIIKGTNAKKIRMWSDDIASDEKDYYIEGKPFHVSDYASFRVISNYWCIDKNFAYHEDYHGNISRVKLKDYSSFEDINDDYATDKYQVYFRNSVVEGAGPTTFKLIKEYESWNIGQDKNWVYCENQKTDIKDIMDVNEFNHSFFVDDKYIYTKRLQRMPDGTDEQTLSALGDYEHNWTADQKRVYWQNKVVSNADVKRFMPINELILYKNKTATDKRFSPDYGKDGKHIYYRNSILKDADYKTFACGFDNLTNLEFACDKNRFYKGHPSELTKLLLAKKIRLRKGENSKERIIYIGQ